VRPVQALAGIRVGLEANVKLLFAQILETVLEVLERPPVFLAGLGQTDFIGTALVAGRQPRAA
jgi:hypothetical protein